jgi:hypothetical protein
MLKISIKLIISSAFMIWLTCISGCDKQYNQETGFLEGKISIGPLCPVETDPPQPGCLPTAETYKAYPVSIWTSNARRKLDQINPSLDGSYKVELAPGNYLIKLDKEQHAIGSSNLPFEVSIISRKETKLDINIDTGIR